MRQVPNILSPLLWTFLLGSACQSQPSVFTGEIRGFNRDSLYLFRWESARWERIAATKVEAGRFAFKTKIPAGIYLWGISPQEGDIIWLEEKESSHIQGDAYNLFQHYTYEKGLTNQSLLNLRRTASSLYQLLSQTPQDPALQSRLDSLLKSAEKSPYPIVRLYGRLLRPVPPLNYQISPPRSTWETLVNNFWKEVPLTDPYLPQLPEVFSRFQAFWQNALSFIIEDSLLTYAAGWVNTLSIPLQQNAWLALVDIAQRYQRTDVMLSAAEAFLKVAPNDPKKPQLESFIKAEGALRKGQPAPDIALPDPEGKIRRLSELRGKWVLIDFWASWCRPCRMENPTVVRLYEKYHSQGFEIFGVSLDYNKEAWINAIQTDKLNWIHVSDLKGWQSAGAQLYRVSGIPFTVLVDPEGRIAAKGLRGASLEQRLKEIFP
ncbi:MAG: TlpA disulfide reductase family protein [Bacteroidia bacterium]|nr:AhpC/TSA family protein [Bacteroidia bacterium]MDW8134443.1 TlpA disulfide reductase family protein [Bacteroidia bacterium]